MWAGQVRCVCCYHAAQQCQWQDDVVSRRLPTLPVTRRTQHRSCCASTLVQTDSQSEGPRHMITSGPVLPPDVPSLLRQSRSCTPGLTTIQMGSCVLELVRDWACAIPTLFPSAPCRLSHSPATIQDPHGRLHRQNRPVASLGSIVTRPIQKFLNTGEPIACKGACH